MTFEYLEPGPQRKTPTVIVRNRRSGAQLGWVSWYGAWRQFTFFAKEGCVFNDGCLDEIRQVIAALAAERKERLRT